MKAILLISCLYALFLAVVGCAAGKEMPEVRWEICRLVDIKPMARFTGEWKDGIWQVWEVGSDKTRYVRAVEVPGKEDSLIGRVEGLFIVIR